MLKGFKGNLSLLGFSFLNSFSFGLAFSDVLLFFMAETVWESPEKVQKRSGSRRKSSETVWEPPEKQKGSGSRTPC